MEALIADGTPGLDVLIALGGTLGSIRGPEGCPVDSRGNDDSEMVTRTLCSPLGGIRSLACGAISSRISDRLVLIFGDVPKRGRLVRQNDVGKDAICGQKKGND